MKIINNNIKLVIWDLDDTFWNGTISEGPIAHIERNVLIVKELTNRGIINSISSKNNFEAVKKELEALQIWEYFVFPQVSWDPKGKVIQDLLETLNLRADNTLFIDDNVLNLNEALFFSPNLNVCLPEHIDALLENDNLKGKDDSDHTRLAQYKNLEKKQVDFSKSQLSNIEFLKGSDIRVKIHNDCLSEIDRIHELVERTNQLNYTKNRVSLAELKAQVNDENASSGYIKVTDKYGDYGISGFYLVKNNELVHYLFSCRTMNMYIESWVYKQLGCPKLEVVGEVAIDLEPNEDMSFINDDGAKANSSSDNQISGDQKILMIGGCDVDQIVYYLNYDKIETEFNYINGLALNVQKDNTFLIKQLTNLDNSHNDVIKSIPFLDFTDGLKINTGDWDILIFSLLNDYKSGLYRHKRTGFVLHMDALNIDFTKETNRDKFPKHLVTLPEAFLKSLREDYESIGPISAEELKDHITWLLKTYKNKKFIFLNGSEVVFEKGNPWEKDMHKRHIELNKALRSFESFENVKIIDVARFVKDENDITNNIRHYKKIAYKRISDEIVSVTNDWLDNKLSGRSNMHILYGKVVRKLKEKLKIA